MILLDTHTLLWLVLDHPRLGSKARKLIHRNWPRRETAVSVITFWEVALLERKRRIRIDADVEEWRRSRLALGLVELPVSGPVALRAATLPSFPADPADRFIVATALTEGCCLVTADRAILDWRGPLDRFSATD